MRWQIWATPPQHPQSRVRSEGLWRWLPPVWASTWAVSHSPPVCKRPDWDLRSPRPDQQPQKRLYRTRTALLCGGKPDLLYIKPEGLSPSARRMVWVIKDSLLLHQMREYLLWIIQLWNRGCRQVFFSSALQDIKVLLKMQMVVWNVFTQCEKGREGGSCSHYLWTIQQMIEWKFGQGINSSLSAHSVQALCWLITPHMEAQMLSWSPWCCSSTQENFWQHQSWM